MTEMRLGMKLKLKASLFLTYLMPGNDTIVAYYLILYDTTCEDYDSTARLEFTI